MHALTQATQAYARLLEAGEVEARLAALERALEWQRVGAGARHAMA